MQGLWEHPRFLLGNEAALEALRDWCGEIEALSLEAPAGGRSDRLWLTITGMAETAQFIIPAPPGSDEVEPESFHHESAF